MMTGGRRRRAGTNANTPLPPLPPLRYFGPEQMLQTDCLTDFTWSKMLGSGQFGTAHQTCRKSTKECNHVTKIVLLDTKEAASGEQTTEAQFRREAAISENMGKLGVAPLIQHIDVCNVQNRKTGKIYRAGLLTMDRWETTVDQWILSYPELFLDNSDDLKRHFGILAKRMNKAGIYHRDMNRGNLMLKLDPKTHLPTAYAIIDFGRATTEAEVPEDERDVDTYGVAKSIEAAKDMLSLRGPLRSAGGSTRTRFGRRRFCR
jgi:tRNA A-37 threonylcarbamoyl transferase component Bud32